MATPAGIAVPVRPALIRSDSSANNREITATSA
jgi:hypothetical protein